MNKKGFTLAELLGVIVILILLVLIATPIVINYTKKASDSVYDVQVKTIKTSAKEWASDKNNFKLLPTEDNECVEVSIEKLKEAGYLDYNIKNPKTNEKFDDDLTVIIRKEGNSLTYDFNEDGTQVCSTIITTDYPKWVFISSTPTIASATNEITINIESSKKISEYNLTADNIIVKAGSTINDNANILVNCTNGEKLLCEVKINNIEGDGRLTLIIDKNVMKDEDLNPSRKTSIQTDTVVDTNGPKISYTGRTNTNASTYYATKDDEVTIKFKAEDNQNITNNLTSNDIKVYLDGIEVDCTKELTVTGSGKSLSYALKLTNVTGSGKISIKVPSGKITDAIGNANNEKTLTPGLTYDNNNPVITFEPNGEARYLQSITPTIHATDDETGVDEDTIKYVISTNNNATPNVPISNGGEITIKDVTGSYYIIGYACDYAGNCSKTVSEVYHMNNSGPSIEIIPIGNSGYAKTENIKIKVTAAGTALDEGSFAYALSTSSTAEPDTTFVNNTNLNIPALTGQYYIIARACDMDSNCSLMISNKFYFDNTSPEIKYEPNGTSSAWRKSQAVNITVTDNVELDWAKYIISTDKTATPTIAISSGSVNPTISGLTGIYYIVAKGCDKLGNCSMSNSDKYYFDNTLPTIDISIDKKNATIKLKDVHSGLSGYKVTTTTDVPTSWDPVSGVNADVNKTFVATSAGTYYVHVKDTAGNINRKEFEIPANAFCSATPGDYWEFPYSGNVVEFEVPCDGNYKLEVWGAQGGSGGSTDSDYTSGSKTPGKGGYSAGYIYLEGETKLNVVVGGAGYSSGHSSTSTGGFNGGGNGHGQSDSNAGSGGGASHIALTGGSYTTLASYGNADTAKNYVLIVAGGGGGAMPYGANWSGSGGAGGGTSGGGANSSADWGRAVGGSQTAGGRGSGNGSFGKGGSASGDAAGGGGGWYGGGAGTGGAGGSGWLGGVKYGTTTNGTRSGSGLARINFEGADSCLDINEYKIFNYSGTIQEFKVMCDGTYKFEVWGGEGGTNNYAGGKGGYASGTAILNTGETLYVAVGGAGSSSVRTGEWTTWCYNTTYTAGSTFNGGAQGYASCHMDHVSYECHYALSGSGGGATHIGTFDTTLAAHASDSGLYIVAGGGGGGMYSHEPRENGGSDRSWGASGNPGCDSNSGTTGTYGSGSGPSGGGGYKGGAAGSWDHNGGRGGSCYVGGVSNGQIIAGNASMPTYDGTSTMTGNSGNGVAKITRIA